MQNNYDEKLEKQLSDKIAEMEDKDYVFPKRFSWKDYVITFLLVFLSLAGIIWGAYI